MAQLVPWRTSTPSGVRLIGLGMGTGFPKSFPKCQTRDRCSGQMMPISRAFLRGAVEIRTRVHGFAGRCVATPPRRRGAAAVYETCTSGLFPGPNGRSSGLFEVVGGGRPARNHRAGRLAMLPVSRAISSAGRAPARQAGGHWFEPSIAHEEGPGNRAFFSVGTTSEVPKRAGRLQGYARPDRGPRAAPCEGGAAVVSPARGSHRRCPPRSATATGCCGRPCSTPGCDAENCAPFAGRT
jgi:hypothetical protein